MTYTLTNLTLPHASVTLDGDRVKIEAPATPELREQLKPKGRWKPDVGEAYWFITDDGLCRQQVWTLGLINEYRLSIGNVHQTKQSALAHHNRQVLRQKLYDLRDECGGFVSDGSKYVWVPTLETSKDGGWLMARRAVASEFAFEADADFRRFFTEAAPLLTEYFKGVQP